MNFKIVGIGLATLFTSLINVSFSQASSNTPNSNNNNLDNILLLQLKSINFQAGKEVINIQKAKSLKNIKTIPQKEFENTPNKELMKKYSKQLSILSSIYLDEIMKKNAEFIALYKANQIFLDNFAYLTDKRMKTYITETTSLKYENNPTGGNVITIAWEKPQTTNKRIVNNIQNTQTQMIIKKKNPSTKSKYYGYCTFENKINVYTKPINTKTICVLTNNEGKNLRGYLYGKLVPDLRNKALYFRPIFFETEDGKIKPVETLMVMTADKKTNNVANIVNERVLEKVLANASSKTLEDVKEALKQKYGEGQTQNIYVSGDLVVQKRDSSLINIGQLAFKDFLTTIAEEFANLTKKNLNNIPTIFTVEQGQTIYVELLIKS
jgi:hypothetical protein